VLRVLNHETGKFEALSVEWEEENVTALKSA